MSFTKIGENLDFDINSSVLLPKQALVNDEITQRFVKMAKKLKRVAPRAQDFLYASAIMMHAAEASLIDQATGEPIKNAKGDVVSGSFEAFKLKGKDSVKWVSADSIRPYKNANGDIFPEAELLKAYKKWIGKPLCKDHKSDSVDGIRGIIIDTYYDPKFKRVHALFALDKKNYGDLARKVETGYATSVSMGTGVGRSICTECGNPAATEKEYCNCIRSRANYGEINLDLNPIELSIVVNGADHLAKIKNIVASVNSYVQKKQARIEQLVNDRCVNPTELQSLADSVAEIQIKLNNLMNLQKSASTKTAADVGEISKAIEVLQTQIDKEEDPERQNILRQKIDSLVDELGVEDDNEEDYQPIKNTKIWPQATGGGSEPSFSSFVESDTPHPAPGAINPMNSIGSGEEGDKKQGALDDLGLLRSKIESMQQSISELQRKTFREENNMNSARLRARAKNRRAYWLGGGGVNEPTPGKPKYEKEDADKIRNTEDKQMVGEPMETGSEGLHPGDAEKLEEAGRDGLNLSKAQLEDRKMQRHAYWLGGGGINEPTPGKPKYEKEDADKIRNTEDKQLEVKDLGGTDGMVPGDKEVKEKLLRAKLRAKFTKVADDKGGLRKDASRWDIFAGDKLILSATGSEIYGDEINENWDYLSSADYGREVIKHIRSEGFDRVAYLLKGAADPAADPMAMPAPGGELPPPPVEPAPAVEPESKVDVKKPKDEAQEKINAALTEIEAKIDEIRNLSEGVGDKGLVDIDVNVEKKDDTVAASREDMLTVLALMDESADELALASEAFEKLETVDGKLLDAVTAALQDSQMIMSQASLVIEAKKKKEKKVKKDKKEVKKDKEEKEEEVKEEKEEKKEDEKEKKAQELLTQALKVRAENRANMLAKLAEPVKETCSTCHGEKAKSCTCPAQHADDVALEDLLDMPAEDCVGMDCGDSLVVEESPVDVLASRKAKREELIAKAADKILGKYELTLGPAETVTEKTFFQAHPGGKGTVTKLDIKTDEAKVETISEIHEKMREVAEKPVSVREAAAELQEKIVEGKVKASDVEQLVAEGKVDSAAAAYWKKYFAQADGAGSFGADLSKEFANKKKEASEDMNRIKLRRAYDLGLQAQDKGIIGLTRQALESYVDEVMKFDDAAFESTKRIVASMSGSSKKSGTLPRVGTDAAKESMNVTASVSEPTKEPTVLDQLGGLGWK